ncbi:SHOCT domain-containing protein [Paeniglutamicibacter sp. NPDC091659]|uniref:SHOCT domain-containing protein n=1 Tax=Paeniglutamicibacter sp. NPDC091659 TaxID=3364389 RepID=UPI00381CD4D7
MDFWASFWNIIWFFVSAFIFIAYLIALFSIITDLFRDRELSGGLKALWFIALIFVSLPTALIYLIVRGKGMAERSRKNIEESTRAAEDYIRTVAQVSPSDEIAKAKALHESGAITAEEYEHLKARALGTSSASVPQQ